MMGFGFNAYSTDGLIDGVGGDVDYIIERNSHGAPLVISFSFAQWGDSCDFDFYGRLKKLETSIDGPINKIFLRDRSNTWYQNGCVGLGENIEQVTKSLERFIAELNPSDIYLIGQSMGGYAALIFGAVLKVNKVISFAPMSFLSVEKLKNYGDTRYLSAMETIERIDGSLKYTDIVSLYEESLSNPEVHVVFGSKSNKSDEEVNLDALHALRLESIGNSHIYSYEDAGHLVVKHLSDLGEMDDLLLKIIFGNAKDNRVVQLENKDNIQISDAWYTWIFRNILAGCSEDSLIEAVELENPDSKKELVREIRNAKKHPFIMAAEDGCYVLSKRNWLLETIDKLSALDDRYCLRIDKIKVPSFECFISEYYSKNIPVIIMGGVNDWPALTHWSPEYFERSIGDEVIEIQYGRSSDPEFEINSNKYKKKIKMREYCQMVLDNKGTNDYYLTANNNYGSIAGLGDIFDDVGDFGVGYRNLNSIKTQSHLWFGPKGTFTPLHHDLTNNMLVQLYGRKKITLIPALQAPFVYNAKHVYSATDFPVVDEEKFPLMKNITPVEIIVHPGESLFIPIGWWHCVESLDVSISVSFTNFNVCNSFNKDFPR